MLKIDFYVRTINGVKSKRGYLLKGKYDYGVYHTSRKVFRIAELRTGLDCTPQGLTKVKEFEEHLKEIDKNFDELGSEKYNLGVVLLNVFIKKEKQRDEESDK